MLNVIKADAGTSGIPGNRPGSYKCSWECLYYVKVCLTRVIYDVQLNYRIVHLVLVQLSMC